MWKEYTRETPARPGLGPLASALLLAGVVWLAWIFTASRAKPMEETREILRPGWPIAFQVPAKARAIGDRFFESEADGMSGEDIFILQQGREHLCQIETAFRVLRPGTTSEEAAKRLIGRRPANPESISIGPMEGLIDDACEDTMAPSWQAVACSPDGLAIAFRVSTSNSSRKAEALLRALCGSVRFKTWVVPR